MRRLNFLKKKINLLADRKKAAGSARFFKTGVGTYGEGEQFLGINNPDIRLLSKEFKDLSLGEIEKLIYSKYNEERMLGLLILVLQFSKDKDEGLRREIYEFYVEHMAQVNNWNLVDLSAREIIGGYLEDRDRKILRKWAKSKNLWYRRIAIIATYHFIRLKDFEDTLEIAEMLLKDEEDLIHKAVGWMLREIGKRDLKELEKFLKVHYSKMPRTMLRYAIEKFDEPKRKGYLSRSTM